jgi:signal transduction histidine kinase
MSAPVTWLVSVRGRITVAVTVVFGLAMALGGWFLLDRAEAAWIDDLEAADLDELEMLAQDLQAFEAIVGDEFFLPVGVDGTSFELLDETGQIVAETPQGVFGGAVIITGKVPPDQFPPEVFAGNPGIVEFGVIGDVTTVSLPVELSGGTLTLTASSSLEPVQAGVSALRDILWIVVPLLVAGVGASAWYVTGRAFRPVADITSQVERISDDRLDERVPVPSSRDEVAHLATTMNTMLDRLSTSRRRQREFVSDASHELRNPVATSKTKLEVALAHPDLANWEEVAGVVLEEQERLGGLVDDMLMLARIDEGIRLQHSDVDLDDIVFAEATRAPLVEVDVSSVEPARVRGDVRQLTHLVRNLLDNALRHANHRVQIRMKTEGGTVVLQVDDDGPGIPIEDRSRVLERFIRLEDSRARDEGGAGLGLALVDAVASAHGGTVVVSESESGGARFEIRLPAAAS